MLQTVVPIYEKHHTLKVEENAIEEAIRLSRRYLKERRLPDAAIDLIDRTLSSIRMMNDTSSADIIRFQTKLSEVLAEDEAMQMEDLRYLHSELMGTLSPVLLGQLNDEVDVETIEAGPLLAVLAPSGHAFWVQMNDRSRGHVVQTCCQGTPEQGSVVMQDGCPADML